MCVSHDQFCRVERRPLNDMHQDYTFHVYYAV